MANRLRLLAVSGIAAVLCTISSANVRATPMEQQGQNIQLVGQIGGAAKAVAVQGQYAYLGAGARLLVVDVSDPTRPTLVGQTAVLPDMVQRVVVTGRHAIVAANRAGLRVIDLDDPRAPREVAALPT